MCIYVWVYAYVYVCMYVYVHAYVHMPVFVCSCVHVCVHACVYMPVYVCVRMCTCVGMLACVAGNQTSDSWVSCILSTPCSTPPPPLIKPTSCNHHILLSFIFSSHLPLFFPWPLSWILRLQFPWFIYIFRFWYCHFFQHFNSFYLWTLNMKMRCIYSLLGLAYLPQTVTTEKPCSRLWL